MAIVRTSQSISDSNCNDICNVKKENEGVCSYTLKVELQNYTSRINYGNRNYPVIAKRCEC